MYSYNISFANNIHIHIRSSEKLFATLWAPAPHIQHKIDEPQFTVYYPLIWHPPPMVYCYKLAHSYHTMMPVKIWSKVINRNFPCQRTVVNLGCGCWKACRKVASGGLVRPANFKCEKKYCIPTNINKVWTPLCLFW